MYIHYLLQESNTFLPIQNNLRNRISLRKVESVPDLIQPVSSLHLPRHDNKYLLNNFGILKTPLEDCGEDIGDDRKCNHDCQQED